MHIYVTGVIKTSPKRTKFGTVKYIERTPFKFEHGNLDLKGINDPKFWYHQGVMSSDPWQWARPRCACLQKITKNGSIKENNQQLWQSCFHFIFNQYTPKAINTQYRCVSNGMPLYKEDKKRHPFCLHDHLTNIAYTEELLYWKGAFQVVNVMNWIEKSCVCTGTEDRHEKAT